MSKTVSPSNSKGISTTSFNDLPQETTVEILLRLGVKDLIRSTSVNKKWYSLINNPSFISHQIHHTNSHSNDNALLIIPPVTSQQNYCSLISTHTSSLIKKFDIPFETKTRSLKLIAQVHGMLLLADFRVLCLSRDLYLWNPYVKRHRLLVSDYYQNLSDDVDMSLCVFGMGFDKATDDYKVIRIVYGSNDKWNLFGKEVPLVEIYSFRKNTWRKIENPGVSMLVYEDGIYIDGCYYWLEIKHRQTGEDKVRLMSFDFHSELFGEIKGPDDVPFNLGKNSPQKLMHFENSLALCVLDTKLADTGFFYCIWLMRQENGVVMWTLRFRGLLEQFGFPFAITKNETLLIESVLANLEERSIVSCNLKSMVHEGHGLPIARVPNSQFFFHVSTTVDTSFPESLIMYEGGKSNAGEGGKSNTGEGGKSNKSFTLSLVLNKLFKLKLHTENMRIRGKSSE